MSRWIQVQVKQMHTQWSCCVLDLFKDEYHVVAVRCIMPRVQLEVRHPQANTVEGTAEQTLASPAAVYSMQYAHYQKHHSQDHYCTAVWIRHPCQLTSLLLVTSARVLQALSYCFILSSCSHVSRRRAAAVALCDPAAASRVLSHWLTSWLNWSGNDRSLACCPSSRSLHTEASFIAMGLHPLILTTPAFAVQA